MSVGEEAGCPSTKPRGRGVWVPAFAGTTSRATQLHIASQRFAMPRTRRLRRAFLLPRLLHLRDPARQHVPIGGGAEALDDVHEAGVAADQDAQLVLLDALDDRKGGVLWRGLGERVESLDGLRAALIVGDEAAGAGVAHDIGQHA